MSSGRGNEQNWVASVQEKHGSHARLEFKSVDQLQAMLAELHQLMLTAPWNTAGRFPRIAEADLASNARAHARAIEDRGSFAWSDFPLTAMRAITSLAVQIRAVDELLAHHNTRYGQIPADPAKTWRAGNYYVIPIRRRRELGSRGGDTLPYERRGTLWHRIVPTEVGGLPVRLISMLDLAPDPATSFKAGAAIFPSLAFVPERLKKGFRAKAVTHKDLDGILDRQLRASTGLDSVVWPELTIDDDVLAKIEGHLRLQSLEDGGVPSVIIAGSWHRSQATDFFNTAPILDGYGEKKGEYSKVIPFQHDDLGFEAIEPGGEIVVLVCDRFLASVAICKDYCDHASSPPWPELGVDVLLIPSMGNASTMAGHLSRATIDRRHHEQRAFVVQQGLPQSADDPKGYVLPASKETPATPVEVRIDIEWTEHEI